MRYSILLLTFLGLSSLHCATRTLAALEPYWAWRNPLPQGNDYYAVAYGGGRFVAVGPVGTITTSTDGITWSAANSGVNMYLSSIAYGNGRFVVVVPGISELLISDDGVSWAVSSSVPVGWERVNIVTYAGDRFYAMSNTGFVANLGRHFVASSLDGVNWTRSDSASSANVGRIAFGGAAYVGQDMRTGILSSSDGVTWPVVEAKMLRSTDGISWVAGGGTGLAAISAGPIFFDGRWVVGGTLVTQAAGGPQQFYRALSTSIDGGATWTVAWHEQKSWSGGNASLDGLAVFAGRIFLLGDPNVPLTSTADFATVRTDLPAQMIQLNAIAASADRVVAVGRFGQIVSSGDGVNWTSPTLSSVDGNLRAAAFGDGQWIVAGNLGLAASPDGITWRMLPAGAGLNAGSIAFGNGRFVAGASDGRISVSIDKGVTWTDSAKRTALTRVAFANGRFVGAEGLISSTDGLTWTPEIPVPGGTGLWTDVFAVDDVFYAVGITDVMLDKNGFMARSIDGLSWTVVATMPERVLSVGGKEGLMVASGYMGEVWTSTDGLSWSRADGKPLLSFGPMSSVLWVGDSLVGTTFLGQIVMSDDGVTWAKDEFASSGMMFGMAAGNGQVLSVGNGGVIWEVGAARFTRQPESRTVAAGSSVTLSVAATGKEPLSYEWRKNGSPIGGAKGKSYIITSAQTRDAGSYDVVVSNSLGSTTSIAAAIVVNDTVTPPPPPPSTAAHLVNISTRAYATTDNGVTIGGFVIAGTQPKQVLVRAVGPTLTTQRISASEVLADPLIELHRGADTLAINDNWGENTNSAAITSTALRIGAAPFDASDTKSAALLMTLNPGVYSFIAKGKNNTSGIVLLEVYDADSGGSSLVNIASRARATTNNGVTIGGFVISGNVAKQVLMRAVGPTLTDHRIGQTEVLLDPTMELHHGPATLATNDNWGDNANVSAITSVGARIGAAPFALSDAKSSALLMTLQPGAYSFIVRGKNDTSGIVLVEVYDAD